MVELGDGAVAKHLNYLADELMKRVEEICTDLGSAIRVQGLAGEFTFYFSNHEVTNYRGVICADSGTGERFLRLQKHLQDRAFRFLPRYVNATSTGPLFDSSIGMPRALRRTSSMSRPDRCTYLEAAFGS